MKVGRAGEACFFSRTLQSFDFFFVDIENGAIHLSGLPFDIDQILNDFKKIYSYSICMIKWVIL